MEPTEIQLARLDERMKMILDRLDEGQTNFAQTANWMQNVDRQLGDITFRVSNVESSLAKSAPTIDEFIKIKHKITGAGAAGKWLWAAFGIVLGFLLSFKDLIIKMFTTGHGA